jgi:O-antigen/teichoic acid export membrane protein
VAGINLKKNILISSFYRVLGMVLIFLTGWISTRFLGVELKGQYGYLITISSFTWLIIDLGIHKTYPYLLRKEPQQGNILFTWSLLQFCCEILFFSGVGLALMPFLSQVLKFDFTPAIILLVSAAIALTKLNMHMQMHYLGQDKVKYSQSCQTLNSLMMLIVVVLGYLFFTSADRLLYVLCAYNLAMLTSVTGLVFPKLFTRFWEGFDLSYIFKSYNLGWRVFLSSLFINLLIRFDIMLIRRFLPFEHLGIYSVASNIVEMLQMASNMVGSLLLVKLSDLDDQFQSWATLKKVFIFFFGLLTVANLGFVLVGKPLLGFMYGKDFTPVYNVYLWLIPASFGLSFGSLLNTYLWSKGFPWISVLLPALALLLNIILDIILIPIMGISGAALATSISYTGWFIAIMLYENHRTEGLFFTHLKPSRADLQQMSSSMKSWATKLKEW